jgi:hypothetical protein
MRTSITIASGAAAIALFAAAWHRPDARTAEPAADHETVFAAASTAGGRDPLGAQAVSGGTPQPAPVAVTPAPREEPPREQPASAEAARVEDTAQSGVEREHWRQLDAAFDAEREDRDWSARDELIAKLTHRRAPGTTVRAIECRSTMCKVEIAYADVASYASAMLAQGGGLGHGGAPLWRLARTQRVVSEPGAELVTVAYLAREGHELPVFTARAAADERHEDGHDHEQGRDQPHGR